MRALLAAVHAMEHDGCQLAAHQVFNTFHTLHVSVVLQHVAGLLKGVMTCTIDSM